MTSHPPPRQSYDVAVKLKVVGATQTGEGSYDLKNPYFRYSGMAPTRTSGK